MTTRDEIEALVGRLRIYAHAQRIALVELLIEGEHSVGQLERASGIGQPALSQQLRELRNAGIVATRRDGKQVYYSLADEAERERARAILGLMSSRQALPGAPRRASPPPSAGDGAVFPRFV